MHTLMMGRRVLEGHSAVAAGRSIDAARACIPAIDPNDAQTDGWELHDDSK